MKKESVKKNFIYQSAYQLFTILLPMILSPYISRVLQADGLGIYSYTFSIVSYFVLVAKLGISALLTYKTPLNCDAQRTHHTGIVLFLYALNTELSAFRYQRNDI